MYSAAFNVSSKELKDIRPPRQGRNKSFACNPIRNIRSVMN